MSVKIDNIKLDKENAEFNNAAEFVKHTDKLIYLTGKAGTGKTTFLKYIKKITEKNTVVLAPTGVAAINAGGVTIHSFFQLSFGPFVPNDLRLRTSSFGTERNETIYETFKYQKEKRNIIENLELLIIDEISMVRCDILDVIDKILRVFRRKPNLPFGGVQVILIGDTFQLPPIANREEWNILSNFYKTPFFFSAKVIENEKPLYIELKKIYRQNEQDFIDLLNRVRVNQVQPNDFQTLNSKYNPTFIANDRDYIILATHNKIVKETNLTRLNQLKTQQYTYEAKITDVFPDKMKPTDHYLQLKVGAQIMFIKNDSGDRKRFYNGKIGKIKELEEDGIIAIFDNEQEIEVERAEWQNIKYSYNAETNSIEEEIIGTFEQFPIRLAWAITVHKSQGLTFEKVIADLSGAFASGQVYVALSRCTSFNGLVLKTQLHSGAIKTDPRVIEFAKNETSDNLIAKELNTGKADFYYKKAREYFQNGNIKSSFDFLKRALKYRNDIDTDAFKKFIVIQGKRLLSFKQKNSLLIKKLELIESKLERTTENNTILVSDLSEKTKKVDLQNSNIKTLVKELDNFKRKNKKLNKIMKVLKNDLSNSEVRIFDLERELEHQLNAISEYGNNLGDLSNEYLKLEKLKLKLNIDLKEKKRELNNMHEENQFLKSELDRLKKLKWYHKLIGKE